MTRFERLVGQPAKGRPRQVPRGLPPDTSRGTAAVLTSDIADAFCVANGVMIAAAVIALLVVRVRPGGRVGHHWLVEPSGAGLHDDLRGLEAGS